MSGAAKFVGPIAQAVIPSVERGILDAHTPKWLSLRGIKLIFQMRLQFKLRRLRYTALATALLLSVPLAAQPLVERVEVNIMEIDVVVLDQAGRPVRGLQREDFDLTVGNEPREITNFYAVDRPVLQEAGGAAEAGAETTSLLTPRKTYFILFVDEIHLRQRGKKAALDALSAFVGKQLGPQAMAMLVVWKDSLSIPAMFSSDPSVLVAQLERLQRTPSQMMFYESRRRDLLQMIDDAQLDSAIVAREVLTFAKQEQQTIERTISALEEIVESASGLDGRRVLVYLSDGLPMQAAPEILEYLGLPQIEILQFDMSNRIQALARTAANRGVQIFSIDASGLRGFEGAGAENPSRRGRLNSSLIRTNLHSAIQLLADETGGRAIINQNDVTAAFDELERHVSTFYSLGFRAAGANESQNVKVRVRKPGLNVRATRSVQARSAQERANDAVRARLYARQEANPLQVKLDLRQSRAGAKTILEIDVAVPVEKLTRIPSGETSRVRCEIRVAILDGKLQESAVRTLAQDVASSDGPLARRRIDIAMRPGRYVLSLSIVDSVSGESSYFQREIVIIGT